MPRVHLPWHAVCLALRMQTQPPSWFLLSGMALLLGACSTAAKKGKAPVVTDAKLLIENNATDSDTGFQVFVDGDTWSDLQVSGPNGSIVRLRARGSLAGLGLTQVFSESNEPANDDVPLSDVLDLLPEGTYTFTGNMVDGAESKRTTTFTHTIPAGPVVLSPTEQSDNVDPDHTLVTWKRVKKTVEGDSDLHIVGYQVTVEKMEVPEFPDSLQQSFFSIFLPADATSVEISKEFMQANAPYALEVLAIEESGNQTLSAIEFATGNAEDVPEPPEEPVLTDAKLLIENDATERSTGFVGFADGEPYNQLVVESDERLFQLDTKGSLIDFGLAELSFETGAPNNADVPRDAVLERLPKGDYTFRADMVGAPENAKVATLTHRIPAAPQIQTPKDGKTNVDPEAAAISWEPVDSTSDGSNDINIVGYEVTVKKDAEAEFPQGFYAPVLDVHVPTSVTSLTLPGGFLDANAPYQLEVRAIEESGNQTLSSATFSTR